MKSKLFTLMALLTSIVALNSGPAHAQWQWRDVNGRMVISDQPPPTDVPARNILKAPRGSSAPAAVPAAGGNTATATAPAKAASAAKSLVEQEAESKKRQQLAAEAEKKAADAVAEAKAKADACSTMRGNLVALQSGQRIMQTSEKGERSVMDDSGRNAETERLRQQISANCA